MLQQKPNLKTIEKGLRDRGVSDDDIESFMEELESNEYDYDAVIEDVSDREQSMLLDFFRDELENEELFEILLATIQNKPIETKPIAKKTDVPPQDEKKNDDEHHINNQINKPSLNNDTESKSNADQLQTTSYSKLKTKNIEKRKVFVFQGMDANENQEGTVI
eukprot:327260_1